MSEGLTKLDREHTDKAVASYFQHRFSPGPHTPEEVTKFLSERVNTYALGTEQITYLITKTIEAVAKDAHDRGDAHGRDMERTTNRTLRAFGETVAEARKADRSASVRVARTTFEGLVEAGGNANFAFYQAMDAISNT